MPDMDGFETARIIRGLHWEGKLVALSGYGQESDKIESRQAGFDDHLVKPIGADAILSILTKMKSYA